MADMAVSNSIGSHVLDILIGLSVPWFIQSAIYPGVVATINSRGVIYSVILLFLSLIVTIYLLNKYEWSLQPRLGLALLVAYGLFITLTCMLEFNLFGHVNPPPCPPPVGGFP
jgi:Ca2+/Na+ antiporter